MIRLRAYHLRQGGSATRNRLHFERGAGLRDLSHSRGEARGTDSAKVSDEKFDLTKIPFKVF